MKKVGFTATILLLFLFLLAGVIEEEASRGRLGLTPFILAIALGVSFILWVIPWKRRGGGEGPTLKQA
jgi:hypothetical protein